MTATEPARARLDLPITGMTCASCAAKIEKRLNALDGVHATVNYATDKAAVTYDPTPSPPTSCATPSRAWATRRTSPRRPPSDHAATTHGGTTGCTTTPSRSTGAAAAGDHRGAGHPGHRAVDDPRAAVRRVDVAGVRARVARRGVGRLAVPPRRVGQPPPRRHHHGHAHQHRRARRLRVVGVRPVLGRGRHDRHDDGDGRHRRRHRRALPRGGRRRDHVPRRRALPRGPGQAPLGRRPRRAPVPRRQGRGAPRRRASDARRSTSCAGHAVRRPARRADRHRRRRRGGRVRGRRVDAHRRARAGRGRPGDAVTGATVNAGGRLVVRATRVGADTALARIARLVEEAQSGKADVQRLADRISAVFVPIVLVLAAGTLAAWLAHRPRRRRTRSPPPWRC